MSRNALGFNVKELNVDILQPIVTTFLVTLSTIALTDNRWTHLFPPVAAILGFFTSQWIVKKYYKNQQAEFDKASSDSLRTVQDEIHQAEQSLLSHTTIITNPDDNIVRQRLTSELASLIRKADRIRKLQDENEMDKLKFLQPKYKK